MPRPPALLHIFSTFDAAGPQKRTLEIIRSTAGQFTHSVVAMDGNFRAALTLSSHEACLLQLLPPPPIVPDDLASFGSVTRKFAVLWRLIRNAFWLRSLIVKTRPALILTYNLGAASGLLVTRLFRSIPVIHAEDGFSGDQKEGLPAARYFLRRVLTRHVSIVVVPSHTLLNLAREKLRFRAPLKLIPNGVRSVPSEQLTEGPTRASLGLLSFEVVIGCVAHFRPEKGHFTLLRAFAQAALADACLLLIGEGSGRSAIESEIGRLGLTGRVLLLGAAANPEVYYPLMDIFAMASDTEQMPLALLEAMAHGLPVVCTDVGDCGRMLGPQLFSAVVAAGDISSFADSLHLLARDQELRRKSSELNRIRCEQNYSLEPMVQSYQNLYSALLGKTS